MDSSEVMSDSAAYLSTQVHRCRNLAPKDPNGKSDPYIVHKLLGRASVKSEVKRNTLNPVWESNRFCCVLRDDSSLARNQKIVLDCWDHDMFNADDFEGQVEIPIAKFLSRGDAVVHGNHVIFSRGPVWLRLKKRPGKPKDIVSGSIEVTVKLDIPMDNRQILDHVRGVLDKYKRKTTPPLRESIDEMNRAKMAKKIVRRHPSKKGVPYDVAQKPAKDLDKLYILNLASEPKNYGALEEYVKEHNDIYVEFQGQTPLHKAAGKGGPEITELLAKYNDNVSRQDNDGQTPLSRAVAMNQFSSVEVLLDYGADPDLANAKGLTPLHVVLLMGADTRFIRLLLQYGAKPNLICPTKGTPLHYARKKKNDEAVRILEQVGAVDDGPTILKEEKEEEGLAPNLPEEGAKATKFKWTTEPHLNDILAADDPNSVHKAYWAFVEEVRILFRVLLPAIVVGDIECVEQWVQYHEHNLPEILQSHELLTIRFIFFFLSLPQKKKPFSLALTIINDSPLVAAAETKQTKIYDFLLSAGCDPTQHLGEASSHCLENAVVALLESGADANKKCPLGTPLLFALESRKEDDKYVAIPEVKARSVEEFGKARERIIKLLLDTGVDPKESPSNEWKDYLQWVQKRGTEADGRLLDPDFRMLKKPKVIHPLQAPRIGDVSFSQGERLDMTRFLPQEVREHAEKMDFKPVKLLAHRTHQPVPADGQGYTVGYEYQITKQCPGFNKSRIFLHINAFTVGTTCYAKEIWYTFQRGTDDSLTVNPSVDHVDLVTEPIIQPSSSGCKKFADCTQRFCVLICYEATEPWGKRKRVRESLLKKIDATGKLDVWDSGNAAREVTLLPHWSVPKIHFDS